MNKKLFALLAVSCLMLTACDQGTSSNTDTVQEAEAETDAPTEIATEAPETECDHDWVLVDCEKPETCSKCGETQGTAPGHDWEDADCENPKTCAVCGETEGSALGHDWVEADCEDPQTCSRCGETQGSALGHEWEEADCENPETCSRCGKTQGSALGHVWLEATYDAPQTCSVCGKTQGSPLEKPSISVTLTNSLPMEVVSLPGNAYGEVRLLITDVSVETVEKGDGYTINLYLTGEKTYDVQGDTNSNDGAGYIKVYDEDGYLVTSKTFFTRDMMVGDKFRDLKLQIYYEFPAGHNYSIAFEDYTG